MLDTIFYYSKAGMGVVLCMVLIALGILGIIALFALIYALIPWFIDAATEGYKRGRPVYLGEEFHKAMTFMMDEHQFVTLILLFITSFLWGPILRWLVIHLWQFFV